MSLTSCIRKAGKLLSQEDKTAIERRALELRKTMDRDLADRQAVKERLDEVAAKKDALSPNLQSGTVSLRALADEGNYQAIVAQALVNDAAPASAEKLRNIFVGVSALSESDSLGSVPSFAPMLAQMRRAVLNDAKVLDAVVRSVPVDVVNDLFGSERAAKVALHNEAMNENSPAFNADLVVSSALGNAPDSVGLLVRQAAIEAAKVARVSFESGLKSGESGTAVRTDNGNGLSQGKAPNATFDPSTLTISLLAGANLSSFLHESGHFFLEVMADLASQQTASVGIRSDMDTVLKWFGVKNLATWNAMTLDEKRPYHERYAESIEQYLMEGKAPSLELQPIFRRFRSWLVRVYKDITSFGKDSDIKLSDEVRQVFDRMLASEEQIKQAEEVAGMLPDEKATNEAIDKLTARTLRDMKWLSNAKSKALKALQSRAKDLRASVEQEVKTELDDLPVFKAVEALDKVLGNPYDSAAMGAWKALKDAETERVKTELRDQLLASNPDATGIKKGQLLAKNKRQLANQLEARMIEWEQANKKPSIESRVAPADLQIIADSFGFSSVDHMLQSIQEAGTKSDLIRSMTDQRMLERHGEFVDAQSLEEAANFAIHNDARAKVLAAELKAQQEALGARETVGTNKGGSRLTVSVLAKAAKNFADNIVSRAKIIDLKKLAWDHTSAERRAAKRWMQATTKGDTAAAVKAKQDQVLNNAAAKAALDAQDKADKQLTYLKKFSRDGVRQSIDAGYVDQIDKLLERIDLRATTGAAIEKRAKLAAWIKSQEDMGIDVEIPEYLQEDAKLKSYKEMTVEEMDGLVDTIKMIEHLGRLKDRLLTAKDNRSFKLIKQEIVQSIEDNAQGREANIRTSRHEWVDKLKNFAAQHIKANIFARILDGGKDGGKVWEYLIRPANEAASMETSMRSKATEELSNILAPWLKSEKVGGGGRYFKSINRSLNRTEVLTLALNIGNEGNLQRLLGGEGWTVDQIRPVLDTLTAQEKETVQKVWDYLESRVADIEAVERDVYGKKLPKVERGTTLASQYGLEGGYFPITYDPRASIRANEHADAAEVKADLRGAYGAAQVRKGFTKARTDEVHGRPLLLNLSGLFSGVNDQIHFIAWSKWLIDANRLLRSTSVDQSMRSHYGPDMVEQLKTWRNDIANGGRGLDAKGAMAASWLRHAVSISAMGFNVMSAAMQPLGFSQSIVRVGPKWVGSGIKQYISNPIKQTQWVKSKSEFMTNRTRTQFRELNELRNQIEGESHIKQFIGEYGYFLMAQVQQMVDVPTWTGAYEKAIASGEMEDRAVQLADQAVVDSQGSGLINDLSAIERGNAWKKLFTVFYSFMNTALNLGVSEGFSSQPTAAGRGKLAAKMLMLYTVPAVLGAAMKDALMPGDSGGWDDWEEILKKLLGAQIEYLMGLMVVVREFAEAGRMLAGAGDRPRDYAGPAGVRVVGDMVKMGVQIKQGEFDDAFRKALVNLSGDLFGLPAVQLNRSITGAQALNEGDTSNPAALVFGYQEPR